MHAERDITLRVGGPRGIARHHGTTPVSSFGHALLPWPCAATPLPAPSQLTGLSNGSLQAEPASTTFEGLPDDRRRAQELLLIVARLGAALTEALRSRVDAAFSSNVEVLVITSLDVLGPQRPSDIIELTGMTSGGVTKVLDRLEVMGLIAREYGRVAGDRRGTRLLLTDEGRRIASELAAGLDDRMDAIRQAVEELRTVVGP